MVPGVVRRQRRRAGDRNGNAAQPDGGAGEVPAVHEELVAGHAGGAGVPLSLSTTAPVQVRPGCSMTQASTVKWRPVEVPDRRARAHVSAAGSEVVGTGRVAGHEGDRRVLGSVLGADDFSWAIAGASRRAATTRSCHRARSHRAAADADVVQADAAVAGIGRRGSVVEVEGHRGGHRHEVQRAGLPVVPPGRDGPWGDVAGPAKPPVQSAVTQIQEDLSVSSDAIEKESR